MNIESYINELHSQYMSKSTDTLETIDQLRQLSGNLERKARFLLPPCQYERLQVNELEYTIIYYTASILRKECVHRVVHGITHIEAENIDMDTSMAISAHLYNHIHQLLDFGSIFELMNANKELARMVIALGIYGPVTNMSKEKQHILESVILSSMCQVEMDAV